MQPCFGNFEYCSKTCGQAAKNGPQGPPNGGYGPPAGQPSYNYGGGGGYGSSRIRRGGYGDDDDDYDDDGYGAQSSSGMCKVKPVKHFFPCDFADPLLLYGRFVVSVLSTGISNFAPKPAEGLPHRAIPDKAVTQDRATAKARREGGRQHGTTTTTTLTKMTLTRTMTRTPGTVVALHQELLFLIEGTHYAWCVRL